MSGSPQRRALTEREADFLRRIAKGEDPSVALFGESRLVTASRRRTVTALRRKGALEPIPDRITLDADGIAAMRPRLTDHGRALISGAP